MTKQAIDSILEIRQQAVRKIIMKIHLAKTYSLGSGLSCTNSPFTKGRAANKEEFATLTEHEPNRVCKRCVNLMPKEIMKGIQSQTKFKQPLYMTREVKPATREVSECCKAGMYDDNEFCVECLRPADTVFVDAAGTVIGEDDEYFDRTVTTSAEGLIC